MCQKLIRSPYEFLDVLYFFHGHIKPVPKYLCIRRHLSSLTQGQKTYHISVGGPTASKLITSGALEQENIY